MGVKSHSLLSYYVTYYNAPNVELLRKYYTDLPDKLEQKVLIRESHGSITINLIFVLINT